MYISYCPVCHAPYKVNEHGLIPQHVATSGMPTCDGVGQRPYLVEDDGQAG